MHALRCLGLTLSLASAAACATDDPPPTFPGADGKIAFATLPAATRTRVIGAVVQDAEVARWIADTVTAAPPPCATTTSSPTQLVLVGGACETAAGSRFEGTITVFDPLAAFRSYRFDKVVIRGELASDEIELDGTLDRDFDPQTQVLTEHVDLAVTRAGRKVTTSLSWNTHDDTIADGSFVDLDGNRAALSGRLHGVVTFTGHDGDAFTPRGACGDDLFATQLCLWETTPSRFTRGTFHQLTATCSAGDGELAFETASSSPLHAWVDGIDYTLGAGGFDATAGAYVFTATGDCMPRSYVVTQDGALRAELTTSPRVTWGR